MSYWVRFQMNQVRRELKKAGATKVQFMNIFIGTGDEERRAKDKKNQDIVLLLKQSDCYVEIHYSWDGREYIVFRNELSEKTALSVGYTLERLALENRLRSIAVSHHLPISDALWRNR